MKNGLIKEYQRVRLKRAEKSIHRIYGSGVIVFPSGSIGLVVDVSDEINGKVEYLVNSIFRKRKISL